MPGDDALKVALIDGARPYCWRDGGHRLRLIEETCRARFEVVAIVAPPADPDMPVLAACGRERDVAPLVDASALVDLIKRECPDVCIAPLRGGLAHGILMARACGELPSALRILLVVDEPSRSILLRSDLTDAGIRPLVCDAMERICLVRADGLIFGRDSDLAQLGGLAIDNLPPAWPCAEARLDGEALILSGSGKGTLCFIGPFTRTAHVTTFIDVAERLSAAQPKLVEQLVFIGPLSNPANAPGLEWLGRRALNWPFPFRTIETDSFVEAFRQFRKIGGVAYLPQVPPAHRQTIERETVFIDWLDAKTECDGDLLRAHVTALLEGTAAARVSMPESAPVDLCDIVRRATPQPSAPSSPVHLTICILHKDRPALLKQAVDSVLTQLDASLAPHEVSVLIFDNGSAGADSTQLLDRLETEGTVRIIRQSPALPHSSAMNAMARHATSDFMAFLDDDNLIIDGGIAALLRACATNVFDVVVSNLFLFEADQTPVEPCAKFTFIGPAATAGLFFNFLGDTCMVFRRSAFEKIGGFFDAKAPSPAPDWVLLTRAQAAGLAIGVLQKPAFLYRRDLARADLNWQKYDQHGLRNLLFQHCGDCFDAKLLLKLSQSLMVDFYR